MLYARLLETKLLTYLIQPVPFTLQTMRYDKTFDDKIKHIRAKPSALSHQLLARMHTCRSCYIRVRLAHANFILAIMPSIFKLATKVVLHELTCTSREALYTLLSFRASNSSLLVHFRCLGVRSNLPLYVRTICWSSPPPQRWPRIPVHF